MPKKTIIVLCCITVIFFSCFELTRENEWVVYYFNSFETAEDTTGWTGITEDMFVENPAPDGGQKSLLIGGGCPQPAAALNFSEPAESGVYRIKCWAKINEESQQGSIRLIVRFSDQDINSIELQINSQEWTYYETETGLVCLPGQTLALEIMIGGIVPASMNLDLLTVEKE